jgi:hypothetical protein
MSSRPDFLVCDADATFQLLLTRQTALLGILLHDYGVRPIIVPEVDIELRSHRRLTPQILPTLTKALKNGLLSVMDIQILESHFGGGPSGALTAGAAKTNINMRGAAYNLRVDRGEAYSHATAVELSVPVLSHDRAALDALTNAGLAVPSTVLRFYDLLVLGFQIQRLTETEIDNVRSSLLSQHEFVPGAFKASSFQDGLRNFDARLLDGARPSVGSGAQPRVVFATPISL